MRFHSILGKDEVMRSNRISSSIKSSVSMRVLRIFSVQIYFYNKGLLGRLTP